MPEPVPIFSLSIINPFLPTWPRFTTAGLLDDFLDFNTFPEIYSPFLFLMADESVEELEEESEEESEEPAAPAILTAPITRVRT